MLLRLLGDMPRCLDAAAAGFRRRAILRRAILLFSLPLRHADVCFIPRFAIFFRHCFFDILRMRQRRVMRA